MISTIISSAVLLSTYLAKRESIEQKRNKRKQEIQNLVQNPNLINQNYVNKDSQQINKAAQHIIDTYDLISSGLFVDAMWLYYNTPQNNENQNPKKLFFKIESNGNVIIVNENKETVRSYLPDNVNSQAIIDCNGKSYCLDVIKYMLNVDNKMPYIKNLSVERQLSLIYSVFRTLEWPKRNNGVKHLNEMSESDVTQGHFAESIVKINGVSKNMFRSRRAYGNSNVNEFFEYGVNLINQYPDLTRLQYRQRFSRPKPRWTRRIPPARVTQMQAHNIANSSFTLSGGAITLLGNESRGLQVGGGLLGGGLPGTTPSFANAFARNLDNLVGILNSRGRRLTTPTMNQIQGHIDTIRNLETKLNEFAVLLNSYVRTNPSDNKRDIDEQTLKNMNNISRKLTSEIVLVSDGLFKITGHITNTSPQPNYRTL
jgi:hypothetical protein